MKSLIESFRLKTKTPKTSNKPNQQGITQVKKVLILVCAFIFTACSNLTETESADMVIEQVNIVSMVDDSVTYNQAVAIKDGKISAIVPQAKAKKFIAQNRVNAQGQYIMPGLADMHIHMRVHPQAMFNLLLANGVTTAASMRLADGHLDHLQLREDVSNGTKLGPRYLVGGPMLGHNVIPDIAATNAMLDRHVNEGYDFIKIHEDLSPEVYDALIQGAKQRGLKVTGHTQRNLPLQTSLSMTAIEHMEEFLYVTDNNLALDPGSFEDNKHTLIDAYLKNIERLGSEQNRKTIAKTVADSGVFVDSTLVIYQYINFYLDDKKFAALKSDPHLKYVPAATVEYNLNPATNEYRKNMFNTVGPLIGLEKEQDIADHFHHNLGLLQKLTKDFNDAGVPLLLGTDAFGAVVPGYSIHRELQLLVDAGLTPYQALKAGTVNVAAYLNESATTGTLEQGKKADFIMLKANPLKDIKNAANVIGVYSNKQWHNTQALEGMKQEAEELAKTFVFEW